MNWRVELLELQALVDRHAEQHPKMRVLEAGCGSASRIRLPDTAVVDGIDLSARQLARNEKLSRKIQGDLETFRLPQAQYDLVACWDVLEHLPRPRLALLNIFTATRPGGLVILAMPNVNSFEAQLTKWTPHALHVLVSRYVFGNRNAGRDDIGPFKTFLRKEIAVEHIVRLGEDRGFEAVCQKHYARGRVASLKERAPLLHWGYQIAARALERATAGQVDPVRSSSLLVLRKN